ncbi:hypothetical protein SAMN05216276_10569 [Streptosporangium subroseum]|uniref:Uncharacterized protein n=1 Tax=Streptosporangium subroseum TaxID=106412 RepID=A0A239NGE6_9ACTN|nr:hypothetical protein SAMN05216276_10569 [Streptosporangium subroseum]
MREPYGFATRGPVRPAPLPSGARDASPDGSGSTNRVRFEDLPVQAFSMAVQPSENGDPPSVTIPRMPNPVTSKTAPGAIHACSGPMAHPNNK